MTSTLPIGTICAVAFLFAATLYQGSPDRNHICYLTIPLVIRVTPVSPSYIQSTYPVCNNNCTYLDNILTVSHPNWLAFVKQMYTNDRMMNKANITTTLVHFWIQTYPFLMVPCEVIGRIVAIGGIVDYHCLNFLFTIEEY